MRATAVRLRRERPWSWRHPTRRQAARRGRIQSALCSAAQVGRARRHPGRDRLAGDDPAHAAGTGAAARPRRRPRRHSSSAPACLRSRSRSPTTRARSRRCCFRATCSARASRRPLPRRRWSLRARARSGACGLPRSRSSRRPIPSVQALSRSGRGEPDGAPGHPCRDARPVRLRAEGGDAVPRARAPHRHERGERRRGVRASVQPQGHRRLSRAEPRHAVTHHVAAEGGRADRLIPSGTGRCCATSPRLRRALRRRGP